MLVPSFSLSLLHVLNMLVNCHNHLAHLSAMKSECGENHKSFSKFNFLGVAAINMPTWNHNTTSKSKCCTRKYRTYHSYSENYVTDGKISRRWWNSSVFAKSLLLIRLMIWYEVETCRILVASLKLQTKLKSLLCICWCLWLGFI